MILMRSLLAVFCLISTLPVGRGMGRALNSVLFFDSSSCRLRRSSRCALSLAVIASLGNWNDGLVSGLADFCKAGGVRSAAMVGRLVFVAQDIFMGELRAELCVKDLPVFCALFPRAEDGEPFVTGDRVRTDLRIGDVVELAKFGVFRGDADFLSIETLL